MTLPTHHATRNSIGITVEVYGQKRGTYARQVAESMLEPGEKIVGLTRKHPIYVFTYEKVADPTEVDLRLDQFAKDGQMAFYTDPLFQRRTSTIAGLLKHKFRREVTWDEDKFFELAATILVADKELVKELAELQRSIIDRFTEDMERRKGYQAVDGEVAPEQRTPPSGSLKAIPKEER